MAGMRNELKFFISAPCHELLSFRLGAVLSPDRNMKDGPFYGVRSLYFDDPVSSAYLDKISGVEKREKYRIRFYNEDLSYLRLEKKEKIGKMTRKTMQPITKETAQELIKGNFSFSEQSDLLSQFQQKIRYEHFRPILLVDYQRRAYCYPAGNVRITLDSFLRGSSFRGDLIGDFALHHVPMVTDYILEIKFDSFLPRHIDELFSDIPKVSSAISKFCLVREFLFKE